MNVECFLVVARKGRRLPTVRRVTQRRPRLEADEAVIRLRLELPDDTFDAPLITIPITRRQVLVGVEVDEA